MAPPQDFASFCGISGNIFTADVDSHRSAGTSEFECAGNRRAWLEGVRSMKARVRKLHWRIRNIAFAAACLPLAAFPAVSRSGGAPDEVVALKLDPAQTRVSITLDATLHTVHGIFKLKAGELDFDPKSGKARGSIVVDATSGNTDNSSRDK